VKALLKGSADVNLGQKYGAKGSPLHYAAGTGHLKVVKLLLAAPKINVNVCSGIQGGYLQPLHAAIAQGILK
jgi:ankyrin repeat protein